MALAQRVSLSRNTVQARLARLWEGGAVRSFERSVNPAAVGYQLSAYVMITVVQQKNDQVAVDSETIPEVVEADGISGPVDMVVRVVARDADDLYRVAGRVLAIEGVERSETSLVMREMIKYRVSPLLERISGPSTVLSSAPGAGG